jgi:hypothetical protein
MDNVLKRRGKSLTFVFSDDIRIDAILYLREFSALFDAYRLKIRKKHLVVSRCFRCSHCFFGHSSGSVAW